MVDNKIKDEFKDKAGKIPKSGLPEYSYFPNGKGIAAALQVDTSKGNRGEFLPPVKDDLTYKTPELTLTIQDFYKHLTHYSAVTRMVFSTVLRYWQQQKSPTIKIPYYEYADLRGLKKQSQARDQLLEQLELLKIVWFKFDDVEIKTAKNGKKYRDPVTREFASVQYLGKKRGCVEIELGNKFYHYLLELDRLGQLSTMPETYYKLSPRDDDLAIWLIHYFTGLERIQAGQQNFHKHSIETILEHSELKTADQLKMENNRHYDRFIMQPIKRALQRLIEIGYLTGYTYREKSGKKADYKRLSIDYEYFKTLNLHIETTAPTNAHLIECKDKQKKKAEKKKKT